MRNLIAFEPFTKFSSEFLQSKLNKYKSLTFEGIKNDSTKSLLSRIIQLKNFKPPSLSEMSPMEWNEYLGKKLVRQQAKDLNLLDTILPYETEGKFELKIEFEDKSSVKRGNLILPENTSCKPKVSFDHNLSNTDNLMFMLFDADFASVDSNNRPFLLWQINNFGTSKESEVLPYFPAAPERGSGVHRIVGIVVKIPDSHYNPSDRYLNLNEILSNSGEIISYNFFLTTWTKSVSNHFKAMNLKERIFGDFFTGPGQSHA